MQYIQGYEKVLVSLVTGEARMVNGWSERQLMKQEDREDYDQSGQL